MHLPHRLAPCALALALLSAGCVSVPSGSMPARSIDAAAGRSAGSGPVAQPALPSAAELHAAFRLGRQELMAGRVRAAIEHFAFVLDRDPRHVEALNAAAVAVAELDRLPEAVALLRRAVALAPQAVHLRNNLGHALYRSGDLAQARAELRIALELQPNNALALRNLTLLGQASAPVATAAPQPTDGRADPGRAAASAAPPAGVPSGPAMPAAGLLAAEPTVPASRNGSAPDAAARSLPPAATWQAPHPVAQPGLPGRLAGVAVQPTGPARPAGGPVRPDGPDRLAGGAVRPDRPDRLAGGAVGPVGPAPPLPPVPAMPTLPAQTSSQVDARVPSSQAIRQALGFSDAKAATEPPVQAARPQSPVAGAAQSWSEQAARLDPHRVIRRRAGASRLADPMVLRTLGLDRIDPAGPGSPAGAWSAPRREPIGPERALEAPPKRNFEQAPYLIRVKPVAPPKPVPAVQG